MDVHVFLENLTVKEFIYIAYNNIRLQKISKALIDYKVQLELVFTGYYLNFNSRNNFNTRNLNSTVQFNKYKIAFVLLLLNNILRNTEFT